MASEISVSARLQATKGTLSINRNAPATASMSGTHYSDNIQTIPTTAGGTLVTITAGVGTPGWALFQNLDSTNYIKLGIKVSGTFYPVARLYPGDTFIGRLDAAVVLYALADTAAADLLALVLES